MADASQDIECTTFQEGLECFHRRSFLKSYRLFLKSANQGRVVAKTMLAFSYELGLGTSKSIPDAMHWYREASEGGNSDALNNLALLHQDEFQFQKAEECLLKAAASNNSVAQYNLGNMYAEGTGVKRDYIKAMKWYSRAASAGNINAIFRMGYLNEMGLGTTRDAVGAAKWYYMAANRGSVIAEEYLARLYHTDPLAVKFFHDKGSRLRPRRVKTDEDVQVRPKQKLIHTHLRSSSEGRDVKTSKSMRALPTRKKSARTLMMSKFSTGAKVDKKSSRRKLIITT